MSGWNALLRPDGHVSLAAIFDVPAGDDIKDYKSQFPRFYKTVKKGTSGCLYYGFATSGNKVMSREGYKDAHSLLLHMKEIKADFEVLTKKVGRENVRIMMSAPQAQLDIIKANMDAHLSVMYTVLDAGSLGVSILPSGCQDTHITMLPEFLIPSEKHAEYSTGFEKSYTATKEGEGAPGCLYYGFATAAQSIYCREGYTNAEAVALHGSDVKDMVEAAVKAVGPGNFKLNVVGPADQLEILKPKLAPRGAVFWELDSGAFWR